MSDSKLLQEFIKSWKFTRSETLDILNSLSDDQLLFKPQGEIWQSIAHQFGCIGRTQLVYAKALRLGKMDFSYFVDTSLPSKDQFQTKKQLLDFLKEAEDSWQEAIKEGRRVDWPGMSMSVEKHIASLAEHERLHHGQLVSYFTLAKFSLPKKFKSNWAL